MLQLIQLTPPGRGAVATLRVEGPGAVAAVQSHFHAASGRPLAACPPHRLAVGRFGGPSGEEIVVCRHGDDSIDLHCHGGLAAVAMIEETLVRGGCRQLAWRDWASSHREDSFRAAALAALADARTERTAWILLDQYDGALRRAITEARQAVDRRDTAAARREIDAPLSRVELGRHLVQPWGVVLAGRVNAGKSSLMNALAGHQRSIVHHEPGTTRDAVTLATAIDGWPVQLCDTAGLRVAADALESAGIELAHQRVAQADLVVLVCDQSVPWSTEDQRLLDQWPDALVVYNKCDLANGTLGRSAGEQVGRVPSLGLRASEASAPPGLAVSALRGDGMEALLKEIGRRLVPDPPPPGAAVPFTPEQVAQIQALWELAS